MKTRIDEALTQARKNSDLAPRANASNPRFDEGSGSPTVASAKPKLKRLSAAHRLADNPKARAAAEAFRDAMRRSK